MRKTKSTNLTLNDGVKEMARKLVEELHHSSMTSLVEQLIREEYERRVRKLDVSEKKTVGDVGVFPLTNPSYLNDKLPNPLPRISPLTQAMKEDRKKK